MLLGRIILNLVRFLNQIVFFAQSEPIIHKNNKPILMLAFPAQSERIMMKQVRINAKNVNKGHITQKLVQVVKQTAYHV